MPKVKYVGDQPVTVPALGGRLLEPGQVFEVDDITGYEAPIWEPVKTKGD